MLVEGINVVRELLKADVKIEKILAEESDNKDIVTLTDLARAKGVKIEIVDKFKLEKIAKGKTQGIAAFIPNFKYAEIQDIMLNAERKGEKPFIVILDGITDPHNLGAIIRTCEAAGINGIIIPKDRSVSVNSTVMKTSAGALENVKIAMVTNLNQTIKTLKDNGFWVVGTDMENSVDYREIDYSGKIALVIGSEGFGMSESIKKSCDFIARIPMNGKINSLNASVAAGIMIYEVIRSNK